MKGKRIACIGWVVLLVALSLAAVGQDATTRTSYDIRVSLDADHDKLVGTQEVDYVNETDASISEIPFALIANWGAEENPYLHPALTDLQYVSGFDPTWTKVSHVTDANDNPIPFHFVSMPPFLQTYSLDNAALMVDLPAPLEPGERTTLRMTFETKFARALTGDQCVYKDTYVWRFGWNPIAVGPEDLEGKFDLPAADYHIELTIPDTVQAYGGADSQVEIGTSSGLRTIELRNEHPTRSVPLIIGPDLRSVETEWNGVTIEAVYLPGAESYARAALSYAEGILSYYWQHFGSLPNQRILVSENPCPGLFGMAADGMVLIGASAVTLKDMPALGAYDRIDEYLLAHELAHLWWGIGIGADFNAENWISEGFAEYLSITYFEEQHGAFNPNLLDQLQPGLVEDILSEAVGYLNLRRHLSELPYLTLLHLGFDEPIVEPIADSQYLNGLTVRTYNKGYLVLRALAAIVDRDTMFEILKTAHNEWAGRLLTVREFEDLAEQVSDRDLSQFFASWLYGDVQFDVVVSGFDTTETASGYTTRLQITGAGPDLPVTVEASLDDGSTVREQLPADCCSPAGWAIETSRPVVAVTLDPDEVLPDANRFNNHWPRKIDIAYPFRPKDAPEIGMPLDAYVIRLSATGISGGFRNDHAWSLTVLPHVDGDTDWGSLVTQSFEPEFDVIGVFAANLSRDLGLSFSAAITALDPRTGDGQLEATASILGLGFTHPPTGSAGQYWYPAWRQTLTIGVRGTLLHPIPVLSLSITRDDRLSLYLVNSLTLQLGVPGLGTEPFGTLSWQAAKRWCLAPLFYLDASTSVEETLYRDLPDEFLFSMDKLHAFEYLPMGHHQVFASLEVVFPPLVRDSGYAIFNLTRLDSIVPSVFVQGGRTKSNCTFACQAETRLEAGAGLTFSFAGFLGTTLTAEIGVAVPLVGTDGVERLFIDVGGGL